MISGKQRYTYLQLDRNELITKNLISEFQQIFYLLKLIPRFPKGRQKEERRVLNREDRVGTGRGGRQLGKFKDCKG